MTFCFDGPVSGVELSTAYAHLAKSKHPGFYCIFTICKLFRKVSINHNDAVGRLRKAVLGVDSRDYFTDSQD